MTDTANPPAAPPAFDPATSARRIPKPKTSKKGVKRSRAGLTTDALTPVKKPKDRDYTTGQAAKLLRCSQQTVIRMVDDGKLPGYRVPGSKFRRIPAAGIRAWLKRMNLPVPAELVPPDLMAGLGDQQEPQPEAQG